ncbi:MAG: DNA methylase [Candidatus Magnetoglobus multicellularis str. Araruama]|uniref:DNA methylase n=1 Tax=Candidatus Magnetoglobus multicellularis str. Araruama TaxID=890399 RepID=A0A1V1P433_9BACT|nr:MAG: DNA methylase [Candidatus Magnetoglobus multicellularis str. Araruama]
MIQEIGMEYPKKLIEVALPLDDINAASSREKSIRHGHPSTLHLWWARRPLAAARAVLFAQLVNDPGGKKAYGKFKGQTKADTQKERERLFEIIRKLVKWENTNNEEVLESAREEIRKSWRETCELTGEDPEKMPPFLDPFAGGGSIPLEAQRLGLEAHASDLNPVAVMINKAMIEIPPKFAGRKPVGPIPTGEGKQKEITEDDWSGAKGLAEDVRRYGHWMREEAWKRIGHLYPQVDLPIEYGGGKATVIAWIWARTVKCPNPSCGAIMPLIKSFDLSTKKGKEAWVVAEINKFLQPPSVSFKVMSGTGKGRVGTINRQGGHCICCNTPTPFQYIREEGRHGRMNKQLVAIVVEGKKGRLYVSPSEDSKKIVLEAKPSWRPSFATEGKCRVNIGLYGMDTWDKLFTDRQLVALTTFSDLVQEAREKVIQDSKTAGLKDDFTKLKDGGGASTAYAEAVALFLSFAVDRSADAWSSITSWRNQVEATRNTFARQAIPMVWDFAESNPFSHSCGNWLGVAVDWIWKTIANLPCGKQGIAVMKDATTYTLDSKTIYSTDPPYYDNISYADLSDFFYIWLRRSINNIYPDITSIIVTPKHQELVATIYRHGNKAKAEKFFMEGMISAIKICLKCVHLNFLYQYIMLSSKLKPIKIIHHLLVGKHF